MTKFHNLRSKFKVGLNEFNRLCGTDMLEAAGSIPVRSTMGELGTLNSILGKNKSSFLL